MTREETIARIKPHEAELRASGIAALYLFGSTARNEAEEQSDIDLACEIDERKHVGLFEFIDLQERLSGFTRTKVDLVECRSLRPRIRERVERDMVRVF